MTWTPAADDSTRVKLTWETGFVRKHPSLQSDEQEDKAGAVWPPQQGIRTYKPAPQLQVLLGPRTRPFHTEALSVWRCRLGREAYFIVKPRMGRGGGEGRREGMLG